MRKYSFLLIILLFRGVIAIAQEHRELAIGQPDAVVDLRTKAGATLVKTAWRFSEANITDADFMKPGPGKNDPLPLYPTGDKLKTHDISPKAGAANFDDSK